MYYGLKRFFVHHKNNQGHGILHYIAVCMQTHQAHIKHSAFSIKHKASKANIHVSSFKGKTMITATISSIVTLGLDLFLYVGPPLCAVVIRWCVSNDMKCSVLLQYGENTRNYRPQGEKNNKSLKVCCKENSNQHLIEAKKSLQVALNTWKF